MKTETNRKVKVFYGRILFAIGDEVYDVYDFKDADSLTDAAYMRQDNDWVYVYRGDISETSSKIPSKLACGVYTYTPLDRSKGERIVIFVDPQTSYEKETYHVDNITDLDFTAIMHEVSAKGDNFVSQEDISYINNNSNIFRVTENDSDDFLKIAIKRAVNNKRMPVNSYKNKSDSQWGFSNMKSSLTRETKMSVTRFYEWIDTLGLRWELKLEDDGSDDRTPLEEPIIIRSEDFQ